MTTFSKSMKMKYSWYSVVAVNFFFPLSTFIGNFSQFISQRNLSPTYNGQFVFFCLKNTLKNVSLYRGNKIALEVLSTGNSFTQISSGVNEILKMPIKIICSSKRNSFVYCPFTKIFFPQFNASKQRKMFTWGFVKILVNSKHYGKFLFENKNRYKQHWPSFVSVQKSPSFVTSASSTFRNTFIEVLNPDYSNIGLRSFRLSQVSRKQF